MRRVLATIIALLASHGAPFGAAGQLPGFEIVQIIDDDHFDKGGHLNNCGQIVYSKRFDFVWSAEEIFLYDNGKTLQITEDDFNDASPGLTTLA